MPKPHPVSTNRLEAFSDGVLAVAITLLVLDIRVPEVGAHQSLATALGHQWPHYVAYLISFITIGIIWINHHAMISRLREADHAILVLNMLLLLSIGVLPFATSLMAAYLNHSNGQHLAATIYSGAFLLMSVMFSLLNRHILIDKPHLIDPALAEARRRQILKRSIIGLGPYVVATALGVVSAYISLGICGAMAAYYSFPIATGGPAGEL